MRRTAAGNYAGILVGASPPQDGRDLILLIIEEALASGPLSSLHLSLLYCILAIAMAASMLHLFFHSFRDI